MKKISLFVLVMLVMLVSISGLTSCLEGGGNKMTGSDFGVLTTGNGKALFVINTPSMGPVYDPQILEWITTGEMQVNGCYLLSFEIDYDLPENSSDQVAANGYQTILITGKNELTVHNVESVLTDTSKVLTGEIPVINGFAEAGAYIEPYLIVPQAVRHPDDADLDWNMSYDSRTLTEPEEEQGARYYDLFLRVVQTEESSKSPQDIGYYNAYQMRSFLQMAAEHEKGMLGSSYSSGTSTFRIRVNYAREIKDSVITWQNSVQPIPIAFFVEE
ncbi:MAG: hypothetical protein LBE91_15040 [Tannerella sp.]|jgi:hypothetical protein|nr:hypothetical protein [Tannerella sp.]